MREKDRIWRSSIAPDQGQVIMVPWLYAHVTNAKWHLSSPPIKVVLIGPDNTSDDTDDDDPGKDCLSKRRNVYLTQFMLLIFAALIIGQGH